VKRLIILLLFLMVANVNAAPLITKSEVDYIFNIDRPQYELYIRGIVPAPEWKIQFNPMHTGTKLFTFNPELGIAMLLRPIFENPEEPPKKIIIGSYFHDNRIPADFHNIMEDIYSQVIKEIGGDYQLKRNRVRSVPLIGIEIHITQAE
jgi:hypothetical protein